MPTSSGVEAFGRLPTEATASKRAKWIMMPILGSDSTAVLTLIAFFVPAGARAYGARSKEDIQYDEKTIFLQHPFCGLSSRMGLLSLSNRRRKPISPARSTAHPGGIPTPPTGPELARQVSDRLHGMALRHCEHSRSIRSRCVATRAVTICRLPR